MPWAKPDAETWWGRTRRTARDVTYRLYDPATDTHAAGVTCRGDRAPLRVEDRAVEGGTVSAKATTWTLAEMTARPRDRSLIVDGDDTWVIDSVVGLEPGPWDCQATKAEV